MTYHSQNKLTKGSIVSLPLKTTLKEAVIVGEEEKPEGEGGWINGGFFVLSPKVIDYIDTDGTMWEHAPMKKLVSENQFSAFVHRGFWHPMDTLRDRNSLEEMWLSGKAPWKVW